MLTPNQAEESVYNALKSGYRLYRFIVTPPTSRKL